MNDDDADFWESEQGRQLSARRAARHAASKAARRERRRVTIVTGALVFVAFSVGYLFGVATPRRGVGRVL